jgi:hypothetical protein
LIVLFIMTSAVKLCEELFELYVPECTSRLNTSQLGGWPEAEMPLCRCPCGAMLCA